MIERKIADHIRALIVDVKDLEVKASWQPLLGDGVRLAEAVASALERYDVTQDSEKLHRDLVLNGMAFCADWDLWLERLQPGDLEHMATKVFHEFVLRVTKGVLKNYRIWLLDRVK